MQDERPWYQQFWPWFLIVLPMSAVVASFATLVIALQNQPTLVRDDWYAHGVDINEVLAREREAAKRGIAGSIELDGSGRIVTLTLGGVDASDELSLDLRHPTHAQRDLTLKLQPAGAQRYRGASDHRIDGTWDVTLRPADASWQVERRVWLTAMQPAGLAPVGTTP